MGHIILLGDSIFDNARYVPERPPVVEQVRRSLPGGWRVMLRAVDGDVISDVAGQLRGLPADATHLFISVGGNDALGESYLLGQTASTVAEALLVLHDSQQRFRRAYEAMLAEVLALQKPTTVCTIYDSIPGLELAAATALAIFNDVIFRLAMQHGLPVIDLRLTCTRPDDYSPLSPIEPSHLGGAKIARAIAEAAVNHDFAAGRTAVYV